LKECEKARCEKGRWIVCVDVCAERLNLGEGEVDEKHNGREKREREITPGLVEVGRVFEKEWWRRERPRAGCGRAECATYPTKKLNRACPVGGRDRGRD
jgi:hypothetical protein